MIPAWLPDTVTPDLRRAVHYTLLWGLEGMVLRTVGTARVPGINEAATRARLAEAEVPVVAVDPGLFEGAAAARAVWLNDLDALGDTLRFCRRLGSPLVRVGALAADAERFAVEPAAEALRRAGDQAERAGVRLAVRNEAGTAVAGGAALAELLAAVDHPAVGADWHPLDAHRTGEATAEALAALLATPGGVGSVAVRDEDAAGREVPPGEGVVGWGRQWAALAQAGFAGPLVLEVAGRPAGTAGLAAATALVRGLRQARRAASLP